MAILKNLNTEQRESAKYLKGPVRIIAGPGSGKTKTIIHRIAYMINQGIKPNSILAVTFTNKAAKEMEKRLNAMIEFKDKKPFISTFHSFCAKLIRKNSDKIKGLTKAYSISDSTDQKILIRKIYKEINISSTKIDVDSALSYISNCKMNNISVDDAYDNAGSNELENQKAEIYDDYIIHQQKNNSLDFDDLLVKAVEILKNNKDVRTEYSKKFQYIHVDEFQDTNNMQYEIIKLLTETHNNVFVVGDPDQNIYSWRGSKIDIILNFEKDFKKAKTFYLSKNYRSTKSILNLALHFIRVNQKRIDRELITSNPKGNPITVYGGYTEDDEAEWISTKVAALISSGTQPSDILILYRSSFISRAIEHSLTQKDITFKVIGGVRFYERKEIKTALSYLRFSTQKDDVSFLQIISSPKRGIGEQKISEFKKVAKKNKTTLWNVITKFKDECKFSAKQNKEIESFIKLFNASPSDADKNFSKGFQELLEESGYLKALGADAKNTARYDNVIELIKAIARECYVKPTLTAGKYLSDIALEWIGDNEESNAVQIMTIHKSKGLESKEVFIMGLSEGVFPSNKVSSEEELEEERRLFYVALTRAKDNAHLTYSLQKKASKFFTHLETEHLQKATWLAEEVAVEEKIYHTSFGEGVVVSTDGEILEIDFGKEHGIKTIMANHKSISRTPFNEMEK